MEIPFAPPEITEADVEAVAGALRSGWITTGLCARQFERELAAYCDVPEAVCLSSATAALELTLRLLGIGPGDEVILPAYTYTATAGAVRRAGARPVLLDCGPRSFEMDYERLGAAVTARTKAVIPVDFAGIPCDYDAVYGAVESARARFTPSSCLQEALNRPAVIADAAHSLGGLWHGKPVGRAADFTCFSFHAVKNLTTAEGGAACWNPISGISDDELYNRYKIMALHGQSKSALEKAQAGAWEYDVLEPACKCNLPDVLAALGLSQLRRYPDILCRRRERAGRYRKSLGGKGLLLPEHCPAGRESSYHLYPVRVPGIAEEERNEIIRRMARRGVAANVHYKPLPLLTAYREAGWDPGDFPEAMAQYRGEITLPLYQQLTEEQQDWVARVFLESVGHS